jgi:hypothetical protein
MVMRSFLSMDKKVKKIAKKCRDLLAEMMKKHVTFIVERVFMIKKRGRKREEKRIMVVLSINVQLGVSWL